MDVSQAAPFKAYKGNDPYIFVSYAHRNNSDVYKNIRALYQMGYRVWYDEGIDPGMEWPEEIANAISNCSCFIAFITPEAVQSENVRKEINFALSKRRFILCIHLKETLLPPGLEMQLGNIQAILAYKFFSQDRYIEKLCDIIPKATKDNISNTEDKLLDLEKTNQVQKVITVESFHNQDIMRFKPSGSVTVKIRGGRQFIAPANYLLSMSYKDLVPGLPLKENDFEGAEVIPFEEIGSISIIEPLNEYVIKAAAIVRQTDGSLINAEYENLSLLIPGQSGKCDFKIKVLEQLEFNHKDKNPEPVRMAVVYPRGAKPFETPADTLKLQVTSVGMGLSYSWYDGLPLTGGNIVPFKKIRRFTVLEGKTTGANGWNSEIKVHFQLCDDDSMDGELHLPSCHLMGINKLGIFRLHAANGIESVIFPE